MKQIETTPVLLLLALSPTAPLGRDCGIPGIPSGGRLNPLKPSYTDGEQVSYSCSQDLQSLWAQDQYDAREADGEGQDLTACQTLPPDVPLNVPASCGVTLQVWPTTPPPPAAPTRLLRRVAGTPGGRSPWRGRLRWDGWR